MSVVVVFEIILYVDVIVNWLLVLSNLLILLLYLENSLGNVLARMYKCSSAMIIFWGVLVFFDVCVVWVVLYVVLRVLCMCLCLNGVDWIFNNSVLMNFWFIVCELDFVRFVAFFLVFIVFVKEVFGFNIVWMYLKIFLFFCVCNVIIVVFVFCLFGKCILMVFTIFVNVASFFFLFILFSFEWRSKYLCMLVWIWDLVSKKCFKYWMVNVLVRFKVCS